MKIIVFGATGRVGGCIVEQALAAGHEVTAFVRDAHRLKPGGQRLQVVQGDVFDRAEVGAALRSEFDAAMFAIGNSALKPSHVVTEDFLVRELSAHQFSEKVVGIWY